MKMLKNFFYFFMLLFYIIGTIGGIAFSIYHHNDWYITVAIIGLAYMAFPKAKYYFKQLTE